jgi:hypothetical protein
MTGREGGPTLRRSSPLEVTEMANDIVRGRLWCVGYKAGREGIRSGVSKEFFFFSFFFFFFGNKFV